MIVGPGPGWNENSSDPARGKAGATAKSQFSLRQLFIGRVLYWPNPHLGSARRVSEQPSPSRLGGHANENKVLGPLSADGRGRRGSSPHIFRGGLVTADGNMCRMYKILFALRPNRAELSQGVRAVCARADGKDDWGEVEEIMRSPDAPSPKPKSAGCGRTPTSSFAWTSCRVYVPSKRRAGEGEGSAEPANKQSNGGL